MLGVILGSNLIEKMAIRHNMSAYILTGFYVPA